MNPQVFDFVMEQLFDAGAADVFLTQVIMKKSRPGVLLTVLCHAERKDALIEIILRETTTIGVRFYDANRVTMSREIKEFPSKYGNVRIKTSRLGKSLVKSSPEFEDCKKIAQKTFLPLREIIDEVRSSARKKRK